MTWPTGAVDTTKVDATTDDPELGVVDIKSAFDKLNQIIAHVSSYAQGLLDDADAAAMRSTLGINATITLTTSVVTPSATVSGLTTGRVIYTSTGGLLKSSANFTFDDSSTMGAGAVSVFGTSTPTTGINSPSGTDLGLIAAGAVLATLSTSSLAITPAVVMANSLVWGSGIANFGTITKRKTADESVSSSTTLQDDDHLTFPIAANEEWRATYELSFGATISAGGIKLAFTTPSGATQELMAILGTNNSGDIANGFAGRNNTSGSLVLNIVPSAGTDAIVHASVWVLNGATPGNVTLQFAQASSSATATTSRKGGSMEATRIA